MSADRKRITAKELREMGLLWKINKDILHPLGLALEVVVDEVGGETFGDVWDSRDDPEGFMYDDETWTAGHKKYVRYMEEKGDKARRVRSDKLGFVRQPHPDVVVDDDG